MLVLLYIFNVPSCILAETGEATNRPEKYQLVERAPRKASANHDNFVHVFRGGGGM